MWHWRILGLLFLGIGGIGIVLPVLPTTIFWILAAVCFARSDPKIRDWIYTRPRIGPQVELFVEHNQMTKAGKRSALIGMAFAAGLLILLFYGDWLPLGVGLWFVFLGALFVISREIGELPTGKS